MQFKKNPWALLDSTVLQNREADLEPNISEAKWTAKNSSVALSMSFKESFVLLGTFSKIFTGYLLLYFYQSFFGGTPQICGVLDTPTNHVLLHF